MPASEGDGMSAYRALFILLQISLLGVMALPSLPAAAVPWWLDNLLGLQLQWGLLALFSIVAAACFLPRLALALAPLYALLLAINFGPFYAPATASGGQVNGLTIAQLNLRYDNPHAGEIFSGLLQADYDLLVIQEVSDRQVDALQILRSRYPYAIGAMSPDSHSIGHVLLSKWPLHNRRIHNLGYADGRVIEAEVTPGDSHLPVRVIALHPAAPRNRELWQLRNATFAFIARQVAGSERPRQVVVGDLNATPWSAAFRRLLQDSRLQDSSEGQGYLPTWSLFDDVPLLRFLASASIDHCLVGPGLRVGEKQSRIVPGSDHRLILTRFELE